jgi:predicted NUDIX family phosphoesterase
MRRVDTENSAKTTQNRRKETKNGAAHIGEKSKRWKNIQQSSIKSRELFTRNWIKCSNLTENS